MPYYRHPKELDDAPIESYPAFATMPEARKGMDLATETVTFVATRYERYDWHERERSRFGDIYTTVPWIVDKCRVYQMPYDDSERRYHFPHLALAHPGLIAYTKNDEHGVMDRQTRVKPGKYLEEFYKGVYTPEEIADFIARCVVEQHELKIATSTADIVALYSRTDLGFTSCMQRKSDPEYDWQRPYDGGDRPHPVEVYGESDLAVAYLGDSPTAKIKGRCVVWPEKKVYTEHANRYGQIPLMKQALAQAGYTLGSIEGARVRVIRHNGKLIMPYVDDISGATVEGDWVVLGRGRVQTGNTTGYGSSYSDTHDEDEDEDDNAEYTCEHCNIHYCYADMSYGVLNRRWCDSCLVDRNTCAVCERRTFDDLEEVGGETWCEWCVSDATLHCDNLIHSLHTSYGAGLTECGETWIEVAEFTATERDARGMCHTSHLCRACAEHKQVCQHCNALFDDQLSACSACGLAVRCTATLPFALALTPEELVSPIDGSIWWKCAPYSRVPVVGYWVKWADGRTNHTRDLETFTDSTFDTLDDSSPFQRVADPRIGAITSSVFTPLGEHITVSSMEASPF